ncbi:thioesterase family protein [Nakamurella lactea]|uniref:thioesterase family protein n=1 Tax=Nakamurella lactea TaxID=459515 RepID=UPI00040F243B|nr:thioesterase family protein [Nakamurella lactea]
MTSAQPSADPDSDALYIPLGDGRYLPTVHTEGAWNSAEQHMAPASGLLTEAIENCSDRTDLVTSRISFDILGMIHRREVQVAASVIRPGRTIELVQAEMSAGGRTLVRATAWRLAVADTSDVAGSELPTMPGPDSAEPWDGTSTWEGGFIAGLEFRVVPGRRPGRGRVWIRTEHPLIEGRAAGNLAGYVGLIDSANGIAVRVDPAELLFPNTDLTIHFVRQPRGRWLGLDTSVSFGPEGVGLTSSVLHDEQGPIGIAAQSLTIRRRG